MADQNKVLNTPAEKQTKRELVDALQQELEMEESPKILVYKRRKRLDDSAGVCPQKEKKVQEEVKSTTVKMAEQSKVFNTPGAEKQTKRELFDALQQELEMEEAPKNLVCKRRKKLDEEKKEIVTKPARNVPKSVQAKVCEWSGPTSVADSYAGEPEVFVSSSDVLIGKRDSESITKWLQCNLKRKVPNRRGGRKDEICGKWRSAPPNAEQTEFWECFCVINWDPAHADCEVPEEDLPEEVRKRQVKVRKSK